MGEVGTGRHRSSGKIRHPGEKKRKKKTSRDPEIRY